MLYRTLGSNDITTLAPIADLLEDKGEYARGGYLRKFTPVCHEPSGQMQSMHLGETPYGVTYGCWVCKDAVDGYKKGRAAIEALVLEALGKHIIWDRAPASYCAVFNAKLPMLPTWTPDTYTVGDMMEEHGWIGINIVNGVKIPAKMFGDYVVDLQFRPSHKDGVVLARYGNFETAAWMPVDDLIELGFNQFGFCLAGDTDTPSVADVFIIDFDYKPSEDDGNGLQIREHLKRWCLDAGMPTWASSSGNGFHAVGRVEKGDDWKAKKWYSWHDGGYERGATGVEIFPPGCKNFVALQVLNVDRGVIIPRISKKKVLKSVDSALSLM